MSASTTALLRQVPIFTELDERPLADLAACCRRRKFGASEALFHEGDPGYTLYLIVSGRINIQTVLASGEVVHHAQRGPGEHFGELSLIDGKPRMADAVTAEPCDLLMLDRAEFLRCVQESPKIALNVMTSLAERLRQAADTLESHQGLDVLGRVSAIILERSAEDEATPKGNGSPGLRVSQQDLADQVGTTRESVNRALAGLKSIGAIRYEGRRLIVLNPNKLRRFCDK